MVKTTKLSFGYPAGTKLDFPDISIQSGESLLITGPSGKGKTTLLHLLAGVLRPFSGDVFISGTSLSGLSESALDNFRGQNIGIVLQQPHFIGSLSVLENLETASYFASGKKNSKRALELIGSLGLSEKSSVKPARLSAGQQQRVSIARALMNSPALLLADEPTSSLDDENAIQVASMLSELAAVNNSALIIVTHDQRLKSRFKNLVAL